MSFFGASSNTPFSTRPIFGSQNSGPGTASLAGAGTVTQNQPDIEIVQPPEDTVQALKFNPVIPGVPILLAAGSWDNTCRVWQINETTGSIEPKFMQNVGAPVLSIDWLEDSTKLFIASADKMARVWDLASNQLTVVGEHEQPIRSCHWIVANNYSALMTGGWDKTLRFWDMRQLPNKNSLATIQLPERVYCSDMLYPMAVVGMANRHIKIYKLDGQPTELSDVESPLKFQNRCVAIFKNKETNQPAGYALGSIEGRVAIQYAETLNPKDNFTFKCHRSAELVQSFQEIYVVNDVAFHPHHNTLATVGSDGRFSFWDKDARTKLKTSDPSCQMPITKCHVHGGGSIFAYAVGYDWSRGHEGNTPGSGSKIYLHQVGEDMKARKKV